MCGRRALLVYCEAELITLHSHTTMASRGVGVTGWSFCTRLGWATPLCILLGLITGCNSGATADKQLKDFPCCESGLSTTNHVTSTQPHYLGMNEAWLVIDLMKCLWFSSSNNVLARNLWRMVIQ